MCLRNSSLFAGLALILIVFAGCSSKKSNPAGPSNSINPFNPSILSLNTPDKALLLCGSQHPGEAYIYTGMAKKFDSLFGHLSPSGTSADSVIDGDSVVYTWTADQLNIKLIRQDTASTYEWGIFFNGGKSGINYTDWTYIMAEEAHDRSAGWMQSYEKDPGGTSYRWQWTKSGGQSTVYITWTEYAGPVEFKILLNSDNTGYAEYYTNNIISWKVDWTSSRPSCSGMWYEYVGGNMHSSGSWGYSGG
jgi:hypothetical protein